ncbi:hypothetical protein VKT23_020080 [Stygiomarasmius scandens]|uniref:Uncharacterized protein n=1 Tax=Marasmiellus scandens TaxID=2682957 RepID=A0ABR1IMV9_9AGAR
MSSNNELGLDDLDGITLSLVCPQQSSNPCKHPCTASDESSDCGNATTLYLGGGINANVIFEARHIAKSQGFQQEQMVELESFMNDSALGQEIKTYMLNMLIKERLDKILVTQPTWTPSDALKKNINHYVAAASVSTTIISYCSRSTINVVVEKLKAGNIRNQHPLHKPACHAQWAGYFLHIH